MKKHILLMAITSALLSACANPNTFETVRAPVEPVVSQSQTSVGIAFDYDSATLDVNARQQIDDFVMKFDVGYHDEVMIDLQQGANALTRERVERVEAYLKHLGLNPNIQIVAQNIGLQKIKVRLNQYSIAVPNCPDWSDSPSNTFNNQVHANFGCATASNLALMVGNPRDLVRGQDLSPADGTVLSNALTNYRTPRPIRYLEIEKEVQKQ